MESITSVVSVVELHRLWLTFTLSHSTYFGNQRRIVTKNIHEH
jgi:hypothetical protein